MPNFEEHISKASSLLKEAEAIIKNPEAPAEEKAKVPAMLKDAADHRAAATTLRDILDAGIEQAKLEVKTKQKDDKPVGGSQFKGMGEFLTATWMIQHPTMSRIDPRLLWYDDRAGKAVRAAEAKDMVESVGASGGVLVPPEFLATLQAAIGEMAIIRPRATIIPMRRRQIGMPVLDQTGTTAGIPHWFGGMRFYWAEEGEQKTDTDAKFKEINLVAHKLIGFTRASDELMDDSAISLDAFLSGPLGFAGGAAWMEDYHFLNGTGAGQPLGIIPAPATIGINRAVAGAIGYADLANMLQAFLPSGRGVWIISQSAMAALIQLNGPAGNPSYIWTPNARDGIPGNLLGFPVIWSEKCPRLGIRGDVVLADLKYYLIGDRQATTIESTKYEKWAYDKTSWRMVHRVDGQPWLSAPLTYQDGTTQISPFVVLDVVLGS